MQAKLSRHSISEFPQQVVVGDVKKDFCCGTAVRMMPRMMMIAVVESRINAEKSK